MPYSHIEHLPKTVRNVLPDHAQEIYKSAFNSAYDEYESHGDKRDTLAHKVAWSAVKNIYKKDEHGKWNPK